MSILPRIGLVLGCFTMLSLFACEPLQSRKKTKAEIEAEEEKEFQELADQFLKYLKDTEEVEKKRKEEEAAQKKRAEEAELAAARKAIEEDIIANRKRQELKRLEQILNDILKTFTQYKSTNIEYLSSLTMQDLIPAINALEENTAQLNFLAQQLNTSPITLGQFLLDLKQRLKNEISAGKQEVPSKDDEKISLKNLLIKSANALPVIKDMTLKSLREKLDSIERLQNNSNEADRWALELRWANSKLAEVLRQLQKHIKANIAGIESTVQKDVQLSTSQMKEEEKERNYALEFAKYKKAEETFERFAKIKQKFPKFFEGIPANLQLPLLNSFETIYAKDKNVEDVLAELLKKSVELINTKRWIALGNALGYNAYFHAGYVFFDNGQRSSGILLPVYLDEQSRLRWEQKPEERKLLQEKVDKLGQDLVKTYKIHLMPANAVDLINVLLMMDDAIKKDPEFRILIKTFKILPGPEIKRMTEYGQMAIFPKVVIYAEGKVNAQRILDKVFQIFKDMPGLDIQPRYNARVNSLIWIAQGDGDYKGDRYTAYYEPSRVYYKPTITGKEEKYHLKHPVILNKDVE